MMPGLVPIFTPADLRAVLQAAASHPTYRGNVVRLDDRRAR